MGPGPSNCPPRVLNASAIPLIGHLHPEMYKIMDEIKEGIKYAFQTKNNWTLCISGAGHAAMEASVCNLVEPGDTVLVGVNGLWGDRLAEMCDRHSAEVARIKKDFGQVFNLAEIEEALKKNKPKVAFFVQGESTGTVLQPVEGIGPLCHKYDCLLVVDSVAALGGVPMFMDKWEIDVLFTGAQKCLNSPPGASPISFSEKARNKVMGRKTKVVSFYLDMTLLSNYWGCDGETRRYHHTGPISNLYAIREGLARLAEEGLENSWAKHKKCVKMLYEGIEKLGLEFMVKDESIRLPCVTGILVPDGIKWTDVTQYAMKKYSVEIAGGLSGNQIGKLWRIGLLGYNCDPDNVRLVLRALGEGLAHARKCKS